MARPARKLATIDDLLALPEDVRAELVDGEIVEKAAPAAEHGYTQLALGSLLFQSFGGRGGAVPGGWWILTEVDVVLDRRNLYRPDLAGWRRERMPVLPRTRPIELRPDWVCEILSPSNAANDLVAKLRVYQRAAVPHYWIVDPEHEELLVYRWTEQGYLVVLTAAAGETVRAGPFEAIELSVDALFGGRPPDVP